MTQQIWMEKLSSEGFTNLYLCRCAPNMELGKRQKDKDTVYLVLRGELLIKSKLSPVIIKKDEQITFSSNGEEIVSCGNNGCEFIVGNR